MNPNNDKLEPMDLLKAEENTKEEIRKGRWGNWRFDPKNYLLHITKKTDAGTDWNYEIDLLSCDTSPAVLDWLGQLNQKKWITAEDLGYLVKAFDRLLSLQSSFCSAKEEHGKPGKAKEVLDALMKYIQS